MSASKEKRVRTQQRDAGTDKKRIAASEEAQKARKFRRNAIIAVVCIVLVVAAAIVINSNVFYRTTTAVTIGNTKYSPAEVDVFYRNTYNNIYSSYGQMASYMIDSEKSLTEQEYSEGKTWADYIFEQTVDSMKQVTALNDEGAAKGFALSDADKAELSEEIESMRTTATTYGYPSFDAFLGTVFGKGVNADVYTSVMNRIMFAQKYSEQMRNSYTYDDAKLDSYYSEHSNEYDSITYYAYFVGSDNEAFESLEDDNAKKSAAHDAAELIAYADDLDEFRENVDAFSEGAQPTEQTYQGSALSTYYSEYADWLLDSARKPGDITVADAEAGSYVVMFMSRENNNYKLKSMRHILVNAVADEEGNYTDEAKDAARAAIDEIEAQWKADPTEDNFAALANENSEDSGSNTNGGLYENVHKGQMVPNINDFLFEDGRKPGDTAVLYGESSSYQGWHLVYFVGDGPVYSRFMAENALRSEDYQNWIDGLTANYNAVNGDGLRYVKMS